MDEEKKMKAIDELLWQNARNVANFGTGSKHDLKTKEAFDKAWEDICSKIKEINPEFYKIIKPQND